jgi:L-histidine Nalpha-methyltransferase
MANNHAALKQQDIKAIKANFASDIKKGLISKPKSIPSKYFYDAKGDFLFQQIMKMEEYYLTRCEMEILESSKEKLLAYFFDDYEPFDLMELGAGDGTKTKVLIDHFLGANTRFNYIPIDISANALNILSADLIKFFPKLQFNSVCGEYLESIAALNGMGHQKKAILFLGSNIGNFTFSEAATFFKAIRKNLSPGDFLLTGFDLKKDPLIILSAYNDPHGITSDFNINLLERVNRELGGDFNISQFRHFPVYDPVKGEARSYIISLKSQTVFIEALQEEFHFEVWEPIFTEVSKKYSLPQISALAEKSGFQIVDNFLDHRNYFVDSFWVAK